MVCERLSVSLVLCVVGMNDHVPRLFRSLENQTDREFELIIVNQGGRGSFTELASEFSSKFSIVCLDVDFVGLSRARNYGLKFVKGSIVAFPDDDCWYAHDVILEIKKCFEKSVCLDFISIATYERPGSKRSINHSPSGRHPITSRNIRACSITIFIRKARLDSVGGFDEHFGLGPDSIFKGSEEEDLIIRLLTSGFVGYYLPIAAVYHPVKGLELTRSDLTRNYLYSQSKIACQLKNRKYIGTGFVSFRVLYNLIKPILFVFNYRRFILALGATAGTIVGVYRYLQLSVRSA